MVEGNNQGIDIGMEFLKNIYTNTDIETKEAQPIFMIHRDTVKSFLHEKIAYFGIYNRVVGYIGIEISLVISLLTASFTDTLGIKGTLIQGIFVVFALIFGCLAVKDGLYLIKNRKKITVDELTNELGSRGSIIKPSEKCDNK